MINRSIARDALVEYSSPTFDFLIYHFPSHLSNLIIPVCIHMTDVPDSQYFVFQSPSILLVRFQIITMNLG